MIRDILIAVSAILLVGSCGQIPTNPTSAYIENSLQGSSYNILDEVVADLHRDTGEEFLRDPRSDFLIPVSFKELSGLTLGEAWVGDPTKCRIYIDKSLMPENRTWSAFDLRMILLHEIGHCFGLDHVDDPSQIMNAYYSPSSLKSTAYEDFLKSLQQARKN